jgi:hypothetical protein
MTNRCEDCNAELEPEPSPAYLGELWCPSCDADERCVDCSARHPIPRMTTPGLVLTTVNGFARSARPGRASGMNPKTWPRKSGPASARTFTKLQASRSKTGSLKQ